MRNSSPARRQPARPAALIVLLLGGATLLAGCRPPPPRSGPSLAAGWVAAEEDGPGVIEQVAHAGTGCAGTAVSELSPDKQAVTSIFSSFVAAAGEGSAPADAARSCLLTLTVRVPPGWSYALESVDYRGFAGLAGPVTASRQSVYLIAGSPVHVTPLARFAAATSDSYQHPDVGPEAPGVWSPCGGGQVLWIATRIELAQPGPGEATSQLTVDSIDTELTWRRCERHRPAVTGSETHAQDLGPP